MVLISWTLPHTFSVGEVVTALTMNQMSGNMKSPTLDYVQKTTAVNVTGAHTTATTAVTLVQGNLLTSAILDGSQGIKIEFFCPAWDASGVSGDRASLAFYDGTVSGGTQLGLFAFPVLDNTGNYKQPIKGELVLTGANAPVSGNHTYQAAAYNQASGDSVTYEAGLGNAPGTAMPMFLRILPA